MGLPSLRRTRGSRARCGFAGHQPSGRRRSSSSRRLDMRESAPAYHTPVYGAGDKWYTVPDTVQVTLVPQDVTEVRVRHVGADAANTAGFFVDPTNRRTGCSPAARVAGRRVPAWRPDRPIGNS